MNPLSKILLKIDKALQDELVTDSGLKLYIDPSYNKEWQATVSAKIVALPEKYSPKQKSTLDKLRVGDEVLVSYRVVADFCFSGDGHRFMPITEGSPHQQEFMNGKGEAIRKYALPKRSGFAGATWVGIYLDKYKQFVDGQQGTEEQVDTWMSQFPFGKTDDYTHNNLITIDGEDYWQCRIEDVYAKNEDGKIVSVGNRVIGRYVEEDVPEDVASVLAHGNEVKIRYRDRMRVLTGGSSIGLKESNTISINPNHLETYTFLGKEFYMIPEKSIYGKWSNN